MWWTSCAIVLALVLLADRSLGAAAVRITNDELLAWAARVNLTGELYLRGTVNFTASTSTDNMRIIRVPLAVVAPRANNDVTAVIAFVKQHRLPFTVKSGGHSAAAYCMNDGGIVLDMKYHKDVKLQLDGQMPVATIGSGVIFRDMYKQLNRSGSDLMPLGGTCPTVGVAGFTLGGGYSFLSRSFGLASDSILSARVITMDGAVRDISAESTNAVEQELLWGLKGGGGGNFGVLISLTVKLHRPKSAKLLAGTVCWSLVESYPVYSLFNTWVEQQPDEMAVYSLFGAPGDLGDQPLDLFCLTVVYNGHFDEGQRLLAPLFATGVKIVSNSIKETSFPAWEAQKAARTAVGNANSYIKSDYLPAGVFTKQRFDRILALMATRPSRLSFFVTVQVGGAINRVPSNSTAFFQRQAKHLFEVKSIYHGEIEAGINMKWAEDMSAMMTEGQQPLLGSYLNYIDPRRADWQQAYYGTNYARLQALKGVVDSENVMGFEQGVQLLNDGGHSSMNATTAQAESGLTINSILAQFAGARCFPTRSIEALVASTDMQVGAGSVVVAVPRDVLLAFVRRVELWPVWNRQYSAAMAQDLNPCDELKGVSFTTQVDAAKPAGSVFASPVVIVNTLGGEEENKNKSNTLQLSADRVLGWTFVTSSPRATVVGGKVLAGKNDSSFEVLYQGAHFYAFRDITASNTTAKEEANQKKLVGTEFLSWQRIREPFVAAHAAAFEVGLHETVLARDLAAILCLEKTFLQYGNLEEENVRATCAYQHQVWTADTADCAGEATITERTKLIGQPLGVALIVSCSLVLFSLVFCCYRHCSKKGKQVSADRNYPLLTPSKY